MISSAFVLQLERLASGNDPDAAKLAERMRVLVAGDDELGPGLECTFEDAVVIWIAADSGDLTPSLRPN
ncbi:hypothetical protein [Occallatibacter riparius]|uniref:Uncharacterized protein n=1 Tax=Occallatibacter riparius TaxID=1002689 RepID=A0A9J7BWZ4_9BACT|nr:hypothetical protein [Occallatibacter riparius]UWZ86362.1 hypothetical protein MOP44_10560 [Occallatibacter riparius]